MATPSADDLTARARIRDAALGLFGEHGYAGASIRDIAEAAGVSPGLVQHHFGSKIALREACDEYALATFRRTKFQGIEAVQYSNPFLDPDMLATVLPVVRYMARAMGDGSPGAAQLFDDVTRFHAELLRRPELQPGVEDLDAYAAVITAQGFGLLTLHEHLSRTLGVDILTPEGLPHLARALLEVGIRPFISPDMADSMRAGLDSFAPTSQPPRRPPSPQAASDHSPTPRQQRRRSSPESSPQTQAGTQ